VENANHRPRSSDALAKLVGNAPAFLDVVNQIPIVARSDAAVLISGETGTGKELVARAVHYTSARAGFPFVAVNCGSLVDTLLEDELFGHERGAFTGAVYRKAGVLAEANGGTLFLDEVDALSPKAQVDLLRVIQEKKFRVIGGKDHEANVRIVAAANARFDEVLHDGTFRVDLYYRLCVFSFHLPPLRERRQDIVLLAKHFIEKHAPADKPGLTLSPGAAAGLLAWDWPGNVRELENAIIRGIHFSASGAIEFTDLRVPLVTAASADAPGAFQTRKREVIERFERDYLIRLMWEHGGNVTLAAAAASKERREFGKLLKKYELDAKTFRVSAAGCESPRLVAGPSPSK
jgi:DNA-binding NtrC family response regulator